MLSMVQIPMRKIIISITQLQYIKSLMQGSSNFSTSQDGLEKMFFEQLKSGDFVDARYGEKVWKLAKVIDKQQKYLVLIFDGYPPVSEEIYISPMRVKPLRSVTCGYTGPHKGVYSSMTSIPELKTHLSMLDTMMAASEPPSAFKITQYLCGEIPSLVNSFLMSELELSESETTEIYTFFLRLIQKITTICKLAISFQNQYFEAPINNNKLLYLANYKLAYVHSLQELTHLLNTFISTGSETPRLLKIYKSQINQENMIAHLKQHLKTLVTLVALNDGNGRWLPTMTRVQIMKILLAYKREQQFLSIPYDIKDYIQFFAVWPSMAKLCPDKKVEEKLISFIIAVVTKHSPFDAKLKSLQFLKKVMDKEVKLSNLSVQSISEWLVKEKVLDSLLKYFNPQIFKRYIPILSTISTYIKKPLSQAHVDELFVLMQSRHESETGLIHEIIVDISEFISVEALDQIYYDIERKIDLNSEAGIKFIREFTINAIENMNSNKNKGFINSLMGRKKSSSKYGYYGLNLFWKQIQDKGRMHTKSIPLAIANMGMIFQQEIFQNQRFTYLQSCLHNINKKYSFGQCVKLMDEIIASYPISTFISESQDSVIVKLDEKYRILDCLITGVKVLEKQGNMKIGVNVSIKYFYAFLEAYGAMLKYGIKIQNIALLWHKPHIFEFLTKPKEFPPNSETPPWRRRYHKRIGNELIKEIFTKLLITDQYIIPSEQCFNSIDELFLSYNLHIKSYEMIEKSTIRYKSMESAVGLTFYFDFLAKLVKLNSVEMYGELIRKVIRKVVQLHMRPVAYEKTDKRCEIWMRCLNEAVSILYIGLEIKENREEQVQGMCRLVLFCIEHFLEQIQGRRLKELSISGKIDILVAQESKEKTISLPRNATIFKLRELIMEAFKIKWNFTMFNTAMKREITIFEEEDFSVNAMSISSKGPTIFIRKIEEGILYHQKQSVLKFMNMIEENDRFYEFLFGLLKKKSSNDFHRQVWKVIDQLPTNKQMIKRIEDCGKFLKKDWELFLMPTEMEELLYSMNIILGLLSSAQWMSNFLQSQGHVVMEELLLSLLGSKENNSEKIVAKIFRILLKLIEHSEQFENIEKLYQKILEVFRAEIKESCQEEVQEEEKEEEEEERREQYSIQSMNLMLKWILRSSKKFKIPSNEELICELIDEKLLIRFCSMILFEKKNTDTIFFTEQILEEVVLQNIKEKKDKIEVFHSILHEFLHYEKLQLKKSTQNFFTFIIDCLHTLSATETDSELFKPGTVDLITNYIYSGIVTKEQKPSQSQKMQQMCYGSYKIISLTMSNPYFSYNKETIFECLLERIFSETRVSTPVTKNGSAIRNKNKKIVYDLIKKFIFSESSLLESFIERVSPSLRNASWRKNVFQAWNLEQQKKEKKQFCGLENLGATCYINCLFQQLCMIQKFRDQFINVNSLAYKESPETNEIYQLQKLFTYLKYGSKRSYTTRQFCESFITYEGVSIDPMVQNDADEFFNALMEKIEMFLKEAKQHHILEETFQGKLSNQLNCEDCPHKSEKIESFLSIGLNIKNKKSLEEALDGYVEGEILDGDNAYFCSECDKKVRTTKRLCLKELPNIMVIVLKRFTINFDDMTKIKINDELQFPQAINLKKYTSEFLLNQECKPDPHYDYKLRGVVVHAGSSEAGHYYSFINTNQKWYEFNDDVVDQADYKRIEEEGFGGQEKDSEFKFEKHRNAYILLYEKVEASEVNVERMEEEEALNLDFEQELSEMVNSENKSAQFLSVMLDSLFIRLCENVSMAQSQKAPHFLLLYFHTILLRDRNRQEYLSNIYRIIFTLFESSPTLSDWYLQQIDHNYIREFLVEAPKVQRYLCNGMVIQALNYAQNQEYINAKLIPCLIMSVKKKGMTPFLRIFNVLARKQGRKKILMEMQFGQRILSFLTSRSTKIEMISFEKSSDSEGFFGKDCSLKEKQLEFCASSHAGCLALFPELVSKQEAMQLFSDFHTRRTNRAFSYLIAYNCHNIQDFSQILETYESKILVKSYDEKFRREDVEKYLFILRELYYKFESLQDDDADADVSQSATAMCLNSLMKTIKENQNKYLFMELAIVEINKMATKGVKFVENWRKKVSENQGLRKAINYWLKESQRPHFLALSDEWKRKVINLSYSEKETLIQKNRITQENRTKWMTVNELKPNRIRSELELGESGDEIVVGFRSFVVKEQLGLLTKLEDEKGICKWAILERNQVDSYIDF